jgi:molybdopterin-containing oxidoreductase family molybdopterin binding subunit
MREWVKTLDFFAICDIYNSSAVAYADIVLPACSKFECDEDVTDLRDSKNYIALGEKAIDPLFESKTDLQIERLLAAQWGLDHHLPKTYEEFARHKLSEVSANMEGMTFDALRSNHGIMRLKGSDVPKQGFTDQVFATPTTKVELYYEKQLADGQAFPAYDNPDEAFDESPLKATYPLIFMQGKTRYRIHAYYSASSWLQEHYGPAVNIAPEDAKARGIATADDVEVFNDRGSFICRAIVNNSLRKGELFMAETTYSQYFKSGFMQNVTNSARKERCYAMTYGPQIPFNDTLVEVRKATAQQAGGGGAR